MADQNSDKDVVRANIDVERSGSSGMADLRSGEHVGRANGTVENNEATGDQRFAESAYTDDVAIGSSQTADMPNKNPDKGPSTANVSVRGSESPDQHSDEGLSIADVALESLKSRDVTDEHSGEGATATNVTVGHPESTGSGSTVEINIKTLDSQLHSFNVNKNMPVSVFKERIATDIGLPVEQQRLIFRGKVLKDDDLLSEYHVESGHTLHLVARQPSEFQSSSGFPDAEATANSNYTGLDANASGTHPRVGHVSHSIVLETFGVGDQNEGNSPDISQVIGAVLNSFGIGAQTPIGGLGTHPNMQLSIPVQVSQGNGTGESLGNQAHTGIQLQPTSPSRSMLQGLQSPPGAATAIPTLDMPIPNSLNTLAEFMNNMGHALSQNGYQPSNSTEGLAAVELPFNARGLPSPAALAVVLQQALRLLSGPAVDSLSHAARRLEQEEGSTDVTVRTQIQTEVMQCGLAMQHLGALLLELGRTILTLRIGQSHAESFVNAGPAVYISSSGPNPIMVQPFPLQTNSLFGGHANPMGNPAAFGPIGVGAVPRHLNIHIHAGPRAFNVESNQAEFANRNAGINSQSRGIGDNMRSGNQASAGQADAGLLQIQMDARRSENANPSSTRMKSLSETEGASSKTAPAIPLGLGSGGLQPKRRQRQTRSETGSSSSSTYPAGGQSDPATNMNQLTQNPALDSLLAGLSNQSRAGSPDVLRNMLGQLAQNPAMMNMVNQLAQQMENNQGLGGSGGGGIVDMSNMVQQMMPFVSQALNRGSSSSNLLQSVPSRKGSALHRRYSSVKSLNVNDRSSDFQMNLENAAQKIVEQYPPLEIFSSIVETAAGLYNNAFDTGAFDELCLEEELAVEFMEMLKRDASRRLRGER